MVKILEKLVELIKARSSTPWARFTVGGIEANGQVKFDMSWNPAFLDNVSKAGFSGASEQETVENFLLGAIMYPKDMENEVASEAHPNLQAESSNNKIRRG